MKRILTTVLTGTALALSACVGPPAAELAGVSGNSTCPVDPITDSVDLRIAYQVIPSAELYLRDQEVVEACLPNATVSWTRYATGQDIVQAFVADSADVGFLGSPPTTKAVSAPIYQDAKIIYVATVLSDSEALVARDATTIEDLAGKKIGVGFSSTAHYSLLKALGNAGISAEVVNLSPDNQVAALSTGEVDAVYAWDPTLQELQNQGNHTIITSGEVAELGAPTFNFAMAKTALIDDHPDVTALLSDLNEWAVDKYAEDPEGFIAANARQTGNSVAETTQLLNRAILVGRNDQPRRLGEAGQAMYDTAEFFTDQGQIAYADDLQHYEDAVTYGGKQLP